ncbi:hypothetical protein ZWY2020_025160 [Hordeum vulgare]|nr:hypothetical protein ZWY2020_025160 [Hordeum vulgare]
MALFSWAYSITGQSARICPRIKSTQFSMLSGNEIFQSAGAQVWNNRIYWPGMKPVRKGLLDTRMGAANKHGECGTCHGSYTEGPGHFGYLKHALPVFNIGFFNFWM